ncbi:MAG: DUF2842 domain-containing protein [Rhodobacteraceae bacterium]|nr:DUF2842 domain-containing protein [Paracoccaceae bacterium]
MTLSYPVRRKLALITVCVGLPLYVVLAVSLITTFGRLPFLLEAILYIIIGIGWIFPTRHIFMGIGRADPLQSMDADPNSRKGSI